MKGRICRAFADVCKVSPLLFVIEYLFTALDGVALALIAMALEKLFTAVWQLAEGKASFGEVACSVLLLLILYAASEIGNGVANYLGEVYSELTTQKMTKKINAKLGNMYNINFETPQLLNRMLQAYGGAVDQRSFANTVMDILTLYLPYFLIYGRYLYGKRPVLALIIPLIFLPKLAAQFAKAKLHVDLEEETAPLIRREEAYASYAADRDYVKETRLLGTVRVFTERWRTVREERNRLLLSVGKKSCLADTISMLLHLAGYVGVIALLLQSVLSGQIEVSAFAAVFASLGTLLDQVDELVGSRFGELAENYAGIRNYQDFVQMDTAPEQEKEIEKPDRIDARHMSFAYPDGNVALKDINLSLKEGEKIAIVGENGSGKTTLTRLLTGLYLPTDGEVCHNDIPTGELNYHTLQKGISAVFQNFRKYKLTLRDNISIFGNIEETEAEKLLQKTGLPLSEERFPQGLDTVLSKEFGGIELSGGQWQRIAIARGIGKSGSFIVLDEPTAAIDPMQEHRLYELFLEAAAGKIAVFVTHRLGLARTCDRIVVMRDGSILDVGSHEELTERCTYYRQLWEAQAAGYVEEV